jgi:hypothetical protein
VVDVDIGRESPKQRYLLVEDGFVAHEENLKSSLGRTDGTLDGGAGSVISPHGIECNSHDAVQTSGNSGFLNFEDTPTAVGATRHTDAVSLFPLVAVLTVHQRWVGVQ